jgi:hypothetical protein
MISVGNKILIPKGGGAPPVYEGSGTPNTITRTTTLRLDFPTTVNAGDILIANIIISVDTSFSIDGWTFVGSDFMYFSHHVFWKRADGTEGGTSQYYDIPISAYWSMSVVGRYSGCIVSGSPIGASLVASLTSGVSRTASLTTNYDNSLVVALLALRDDNPNSFSGTNWTETINYVITSPSDQSMLEAVYTMLSAGTTDSFTWSWGATEYNILTILELRSE